WSRRVSRCPAMTPIVRKRLTVNSELVNKILQIPLIELDRGNPETKEFKSRPQSRWNIHKLDIFDNHFSVSHGMAGGKSQCHIVLAHVPATDVAVTDVIDQTNFLIDSAFVKGTLAALDFLALQAWMSKIQCE